MDPQSTENLEYFVSAKGPVIIVTLVGSVEDRSGPIMAKLMEELGQYGSPMIPILYLRDLVQIRPNGYKLFVQIQSFLRDKFSSRLRLCAMHPTLRSGLLADGLIRPNELTNNLKDTLGTIVQANKPNPNATVEKKAA